MGLVRIFIINIWGQCESGKILLKSMGLHSGNIFEGCRMETNYDRHTLLVRPESGPWLSWFSSSLCSCLCAFIENYLFLSSGPSRWTPGCSCLTAVTTSLSTETNTATHKASKLAGMQDSPNWRMPQKHKVMQSQTFQRGDKGDTEAFWDVRDRGQHLLRKTHEVKNHKIGEPEREAIPSFWILTRILCLLLRGAEKSRCSWGLFGWPARVRSYLTNGGEGHGPTLFLSPH